MDISFLIITKHRPKDIALTLSKLKSMIDTALHEVLVFVDGCDETAMLTKNYPWVKWTISKKSISASPARNILYKKAKGAIFIGLDDDAHPLSPNFLNTVATTFKTHKRLGIIAFQEVRGVFNTDEEALKQSQNRHSYFTNDFIGCGFAIKKSVYDATNGFPVWMDIYGEEAAVALQVLDVNYKILYEPSILVNHRIDKEKRKQAGRNYYRFKRLLKNTIAFYIVYYPQPFFKIAKTLLHNLQKYAFKDWVYFKSYVSVLVYSFFRLPYLLKHRKPVKKETLALKQELQTLHYSP